MRSIAIFFEYVFLILLYLVHYCALKCILIEGKFSFSFALKENTTTNKSNFIVSDEDVEIEDDFDDEPEGLFDSVCAYCDNGGDVLMYASNSLVPLVD